MSFSRFMWRIIFLVSILAGPAMMYAQSVLDKKISLDLKRQRLDDALVIIGNKGGFSFSYNSNIIKRDSLVSLSVEDRPIRQVLNQLFAGNYEYKESGNYVILRRVAIRLTTAAKTKPVSDKVYTITGYVVNSETGERIANASIYEKQHLIAALTDEQGNFTIKLKNRYQAASLSVSKASFEDTMVTIQPKFDMQLVIAIDPVPDIRYISAPSDYEIAAITDTLPATINIDTSKPVVVPKEKVEQTGLGRFLLSTKQKMQSLNLNNFFTKRPFQVSLTPGLSSQGKMSGQVVNNFSFNVLGGYSGGVNGAEIGGVFNMNRKDVQFFQMAGVFNIVGGNMNGLQVAGVNNSVLKNTNAIQFAGVNNFVRGNFNGLQVAGTYNHVNGKVKGLQIGGVANFSRKQVIGMQLSGVYNHSNDTVKGVQLTGVANFSRKQVLGLQLSGLLNYSNHGTRGAQVAPVLNYAKKMNGVQIGLINVADTIDGLGIGLINIVFKGYHKLSVYSNEVTQINVAIKTGQYKFYNILMAGMNTDTSNQLKAFGYGVGSDLKLTRWLYINPELTSQLIYLGDWGYCNSLHKFQLNLNFRINKWITVFGGAGYSIYHNDQPSPVTNYKYNFYPDNYKSIKIGNTDFKSWLGWNAGISLF